MSCSGGGSGRCRCTCWSTARICATVSTTCRTTCTSAATSPPPVPPRRARRDLPQALADSGGDGVVAVHLSAALSSTFSSAVQRGPRVRPGSARGELAVGGDGRRVRRAGRGAVGRPRVPTSTPSRPRRARPCRAGTRSSSCTGWTTCGAAAGSARRHRGWAPRCRSSRCCASTSTARLVLAQRIRTVSKAHAAMVDAVAEVVGRAVGRTIAVHHVDNHDAADVIGAALTDAAASDRVADASPTWARCCRYTSAAARSACRVAVDGC